MSDAARVPESRVEGGSGLRRAAGPRLLLFFIIGDMLGTGIYARVGGVAGEVGGIVWVSFLVAFILATLTAFAYTEMVTKYPALVDDPGNYLRALILLLVSLALWFINAPFRNRWQGAAAGPGCARLRARFGFARRRPGRQEGLIAPGAFL